MPDEQGPLPEEFLERLRELEQSYLTQSDPIRQSGFGGGPARWREERGIILQAVDEDGDLLDVGCANGYLLECLVKWAREKGIKLTPYGVDQGPGLIELARERLPQYAANFWAANAWDWMPPRKFRYVYALYDCVPQHLLGEYLRRLFARCVEDEGTLIVGAYGSHSRQEPARDVAADLREHGFTVAGSASHGEFPVTRIAWTRR
jgi:SAM-dependent methyltransferase